jgi:hypothetical protein
MFRLADDNLNGEVLPATFLYEDTAGNLDHFRVTSPSGLSKFALAHLGGSGNVFQMVYLGISDYISSPPSDETGTGGNPPGGTGGGQEAAAVQDQPQPASLPAPPAGPGADLFINSQGVITQATILQAPDNSAEISIGQGVTALDVNGDPLLSVSMDALSEREIAGMPSSGIMTFAGRAYEFLPDGATFSPAVTVTFTLPEARWGDLYTIRQYDGAAGVWNDLATTYNPDTGKVTASVSHFCIIALFSEPVPGTPAAAATTVVTRPAPVLTPAPTNALGIFYNMMVFVAGILAKNLYAVLIVVVLVAALVYFRGRRGKLDRIRYNF